MKKSVYIIIGCLIMTVGVSAQWDVCQDCPVEDAFTTITAAIAAAQPGDTINIWGEEVHPPGSEIIYEYEEHLEITKQITLTCDNPHSTLGYPIITLPLDSDDDIIHIKPGGDGTVIQHLTIRGPRTGQITYCGTLGPPPSTQNPLLCADKKVGIRITADDCYIHDCYLTRCMTGIYIWGKGNVVSHSLIGNLYWGGGDPEETREEYWSLTNNSEPIDHPGNGFGVVVKDVVWTAPPEEMYGNRLPNELVDNVIQSNRYWGVVLTNGSRAQVAHNVIAFNGDYSVEQDWDAIPDKSGGLMSLFTYDQITDVNNDNKLQCPVIRSNNIYGNKGYQIGVFTGAPGQGDDRCKHIYNSPVIMSNNIGVEDGMPPVMTPGQYDFLICAGPTPVRTPSDPPEPCDPDYDYYGSGPIFAWNNYHDPTEGHQRRMYHPMQQKRWPSPVCTKTPKPPTPTPGPPTPTPTITSIPTLYPYPTPVDTPTAPTPTQGSPVPVYYEMDNTAWAIPGMRDNPHFVGWVTPTPFGPPEYDWHLRDYPIVDPEATGTPPESTITPSQCYNKGGIDLNPGATRDDDALDTGFIDMGRHIRKLVPQVENMDITVNLPNYTLTWSNPLYTFDGSLFPFHEIGGYVICWGEVEKEPPDLVVKIVGHPNYCETDDTPSFTFSVMHIPQGATYVGVMIYDTGFNYSRIKWIPIPLF
jgi:hypothetical protein